VTERGGHSSWAALAEVLHWPSPARVLPSRRLRNHGSTTSYACLVNRAHVLPSCCVRVANMALALRRLASASLRPLRLVVPARSNATTASSATVVPKEEYATWDEQPVDVTFGEVSTASYRLRNGVQKTLMHHSRKMSQLLVRHAGAVLGGPQCRAILCSRCSGAAAPLHRQPLRLCACLPVTGSMLDAGCTRAAAVAAELRGVLQE